MTETQTTSDVGTISDVMRNLADAFEGDLPTPSGISYHTYPHRSPILGPTFGTNGQASIDAWLAVYGSKYTYQDRPSPGHDGSEWLTSGSFDLLGTTIALHGRDPRNCVWLGGCGSASAKNPDQLCDEHHAQVYPVVDAEEVDAIPALAASEPHPDVHSIVAKSLARQGDVICTKCGGIAPEHRRGCADRQLHSRPAYDEQGREIRYDLGDVA